MGGHHLKLSQIISVASCMAGPYVGEELPLGASKWTDIPRG